MATQTQMMASDQPTLDFLAGRILIVGLGATGLSCARFLAAHGMDFVVTDSRRDPPGLVQLKAELPGVEVFTGGFDAQVFAAADCLLLSPGVSLQQPQVAEACARGVTVLGDIEIFARLGLAPVIAITGSNGKSTVATLVAQMAQHGGIKVALGGNIGVPVLDLLAQNSALYVLELSSFQLETTDSLAPRAAVILNISEDHMDRYDSLADYTRSKAKVYAAAEVRLVNRDDPRVMATLSELNSGQAVSFGLDTPPHPQDFGLRMQQGEPWLCRGEKALLPESALRIKGRHNTLNALAALALAEQAGVPLEDQLAALQEFTGLAHRCQWVRERNGVIWLNDSKATNVGATLAALEGVPANKLVLIAGGQGKDQDFSPLGEVVAQRCRAVLLLGEDKEKLAAAMGDEVPLLRLASMQEAVNQAAVLAQSGDAVLLSPACASFDMFSGFAARGDAFVHAVQGLTP